jgi:hypothetical protein
VVSMHFASIVQICGGCGQAWGARVTPKRPSHCPRERVQDIDKPN